MKWARSLRDKKNRRAEGKFLAEGLRILSEAEESGRMPEYIFYADDGARHPRAQALIQATENAGGTAVHTTQQILTKLSGKDNPQAVVGIYPEFDTNLAKIDRSTADIWLVAQALRDPGNLGTMLRTGDAVGAGGLILIDDCADPFSVEAIRASMGAVFTQAVATASWGEFLVWLRAGEGQLVGTSLDTELDYQEPDYARPCFVLTGNESAGLPADYAEACDLLVKMPMHGKADSLNAAVATAVMAYEVTNQFRR